VLAVLPQLIPSTVIGVVKPLLALHREGRIIFDVALESWVRRRQLASADVVVFCRNQEPRFGAALEAARQLGKPIVYELDDDFFAIPIQAAGGQYHRDPARLAQLERYLRSATLVRVYSEALRARAATLNAQVRRVDGLVDWDLVAAQPAPRAPGPLRIVYATSRTVDALAAIFLDDLRAVLDAYRGQVEAWFWGYHPPELAGRPDVHFVDYVRDYDAFFRRFAAASFDIGLAPLPDDEFHRAKSDNKFREYAASRIAGIYSDTIVYRERVSHGRTGLLVSPEPRGWFTAMARLIEDDALRTRIQEEAWTYARERYGVSHATRAWLDALEVIQASRPAAGRGDRETSDALVQTVGAPPLDCVSLRQGRTYALCPQFDRLTAIGLLLRGARETPATARLSFELRVRDGHPLRQGEVALALAGSGERWVDLSFSPVEHSAHQCLVLVLPLRDARPGSVGVFETRHRRSLKERAGFGFGRGSVRRFTYARLVYAE
jgi:glycosyltransferase involved in cell wall biosynthesis